LRPEQTSLLVEALLNSNIVVKHLEQILFLRWQEGRGAGDEMSEPHKAIQLCIQEVVESISTPRIPVRSLHRGLLTLLRIGEYTGPAVQRPGLSGVIAIALR
jgi:hypothetical protein